MKLWYTRTQRALAKCFCKEMHTQLIFFARNRSIVLIVFESGLVIISKCKLLRSKIKYETYSHLSQACTGFWVQISMSTNT
ncbi:hypothetical protein GQ55_9G314600 [Panicum hallii var. hallii]|uniref:Uncharacterized protein n=1 Tax=Panicum hallii var. hallii TaxID=1504633 RepID=A0A2T7C816_9POAL|nr:hypothetical protein GQ55_9G314600 [Panicum hallii var. hallii]